MPRSETIPISEARQRLKEILERLRERDVVLIRRSRPVAVVLSPARYEALLSRIEDLEDELAVLHAQAHPEEQVPWERGRKG